MRGAAVQTTDRTIRDLRRRWKPTKDRLQAQQRDHPTNIRLHRAFSWLRRVEQLGDGDADLAFVCQWIAFNSLYGQWNEAAREPAPDRDCWRRFLDQILELDADGHIEALLSEHKRLVMSLLEDEYLSRFFWEDPSPRQAGRARKAMYDARTWYLQGQWVMILDRTIERVYMLRCQLVHGAATFGGRMNRASLRRCSAMLTHLLPATLTVMIDHGADVDWGPMCYPPTH